MYRILIVDDEPLVRRGIKKSVNWNELGIEMVAEAANGVEALAQVIEDIPDIILLDINMPKMDGLEFASIVKKQYPKTKIVIITGYHDFEYARSALRLGVDDYIVKPITKEDVSKIIRTQLEKIEAAQESADDRSEISDRRKKRDIINAVLKKEPRAVSDLPIFCSMQNWAENQQVTLVFMRDYLSRCEIWSDGQTDELAAFAILNIAGELLETGKNGFAFETYKNEMALLLSCLPRQTGAVLEEISDSLLDFLEIPVDFAVSRPCLLKDLPIAAEQVRESLNCAFVMSDQNIIYYDDVVKKRKDKSFFYPEEMEMQLLDQMFAGDLCQNLRLIDDFFARLEHAAPDVQQCKNNL